MINQPLPTLLSSLLLLLTTSALAQPAPQSPSPRPNVLFIAVDDLNDWIAPLGGHPDAKTPNLTRLAARSLVFTNAHCPAPACNPSRVALLTGRRPSSTGVYHNNQPWRPVPALKDAVTLPQHFIQAGYHAAGCGKIFHGAFEDPASWSEYRKTNRAADPNRPARLPPPSGRAGGITWGPLDLPDDQTEDFAIVQWAIDRLKQHRDNPTDNPLFLACGLHKPHMPWQVPQKYFDLYPLDKIALPQVPPDDLSDVPAAGIKIAGPNGDHANILRTNTWRQAVQAYLACITYADAQIGRLLDAVDSDPALKANTIIVLWGDHGWHLGEKHHWRKFALWEEATRTPLMISAPGVTPAAGAQCPAPVDLTDLYPTLVDLCHLPPREGLEGQSLLPQLKDPTTARPRPALTTHGRGNHAVRTDRYRYIRYADGTEELYDHTTDPNEWTNLAAAAAHAETKKSLAAHLPKVDAPDAPVRRAGQSASPRPGRPRGAATPP